MLPNSLIQKLPVIFWLIPLLLTRAEAQTSRLADHNQIGWYVVAGNVKVKENWKLWMEYQFRRTGWGKEWEQSLARTGIQYKLAPKVQLRGGYAWVLTYPYGTWPMNRLGKTYPEHRVYEAVLTEAPLGKGKWLQRYMLEQRWVGYFETPDDKHPVGYAYLNRARMMMRAEYPLFKNSQGNQKAYLALWDEVFIGFGKKVGENIFDQNRFGLLAGFHPGLHCRIEGGFMEQIVQLGREVNGMNVIQYNTGLQVSANWDF